ncbi:hypothetical protein Ddc_21172 [Ditylenchus destructor]|nr:hypothetical protein Ddc_21172 [Ditylenchus destructor]
MTELIVQGRFQESLEPCSKAIDLYPSCQNYTFRSLAYSALERYEEASKDAKRAIELADSFDAAMKPYHIRMYALHHLGIHCEMIQCVDEIYQERPGDEKFLDFVVLAKERLFEAKKWKTCYHFLEKQLSRFPSRSWAARQIRTLTDESRIQMSLYADEENDVQVQPLPGTSWEDELEEIMVDLDIQHIPS